jgi:heme exporter protein A
LTVELRDVHRQFGRKRVLRGVNLEVAPGSSVVLKGANGAGKTTLLRLIATLLRPSSGTGHVCGHALRGSGDRIREHVSYVSARGTLYDDLTAAENLQFSARMCGAHADDSRIDELLSLAGLESARDFRVRTFSTGMRRRLSIASLRLRPVDLALMDEPYSGLDPEGVQMVDRLIAGLLDQGTTVMVATHLEGEATRQATETYAIRDGRLEMIRAGS